MTDQKIVEVEGITADNANLLLAAATELGLPVDVVATTSFGRFTVPEEVAKQAGLDYDTEENRLNREHEEALAASNSGPRDVEDSEDTPEGRIDPEDYTKDELIEKAKAAGVSTSGNKDDIAERLNAKKE
jgi:hypothetical protein